VKPEEIAVPKKVMTYAVNDFEAWPNTEGDDISDSYVKYKDYAALLAQHEADQARITELDNKFREQGKNACELFDEVTALRNRIAEQAENQRLMGEKLAELENEVNAANARVDAKCAQLCEQDEIIGCLKAEAGIKHTEAEND